MEDGNNQEDLVLLEARHSAGEHLDSSTLDKVLVPKSTHRRRLVREFKKIKKRRIKKPELH